jgi:hypothetical protein
MFSLAAVGIIGGTPLVAPGITFSPLTALIGAIVISSGLMLLAILVIGWVLEIDSLAGRILLAVSSVSSFTAMVSACVYDYSIVEKELIIDIPHMAMTHGLANAFGFTLCGMAAWSIIQPQTASSLKAPNQQINNSNPSNF